MLEDESRAWTIEDVAFGPPSRSFKRIPGSVSDGYSPAARWVRFAATVPKEGLAEPLTLKLKHPFMDEVRFYVPKTAMPRSGADFQETISGDEHPFLERPYPAADIMTPLQIPNGVTGFVYVRVRNAGAMLVDPSILSTHDALWNTSVRNLFFGSLYGTAALIAIVNFLFWAWLRERVYLLYSAFSLTCVVMYPVFHGSAFYLFPETLHRYTPYLNGVSISLHILIGIIFAAELLCLRRNYPWIYRLVVLVSAYAAVAAVAALFKLWVYVSAPLMVATMAMVVLFLYASTRQAIRGDLRGQLYLISFAPLIAVFLTMGLRNVGVLEELPLGAYSMEVAVQAHLVMMTVALASRIRLSERQRRKAEKEALAVALGAERAASDLVEMRTRELMLTTKKLERALAKEQQFSYQQAQFVDMISHEFRTPLAVVGDAYAALCRSADPDAAVELQRMSQALDRMNEVLEVGLRRDRVDIAAMKAKFAPCVLPKLISAAVCNAQSGYPNRIFRILPDHAAGEPMTQGDFALLKTALVNLLDNAAKYSPEDQPVDISLKLQEAADDLPAAAVITVEDRGNGISEEQLGRVFEKYYRTPSSIAKPGAGLGLHLVQRIAEMHEGVVALSAREGGGLTAVLTLPLNPPAT